MSRQTTLDIAWWKRKNPILFQLYQGQSSVIIAVNSLLTSKGCFIRLKKQKKIVLYLQMLQHTKLYLSFSKISASALFFKLFLKFRKFKPRYFYKIYSKKWVYDCQAAHQASTDKNNLTKKKQFTVFSWSVHNVRLQSFNRYQHWSSCEATWSNLASNNYSIIGSKLTGMGAKRYLCIKEKFKKLFAARHLYMYFLKFSGCSQDNLCHRASSQK